MAVIKKKNTNFKKKNTNFKKKLTRKEKRKQNRKDKKKNKFLKQNGVSNSHRENDNSDSFINLNKKDKTEKISENTKAKNKGASFPNLDELDQIADNIISNSLSEKFLKEKRLNSTQNQSKFSIHNGKEQITERNDIIGSKKRKTDKSKEKIDIYGRDSISHKKKQAGKAKISPSGENSDDSKNNKKAEISEKYIPRFRLEQMKQKLDEDPKERLGIFVRGLVNKLTENNIEAISNKLLSVFDNWSQIDANNSIMDSVEKSIFGETEFSDTLVMSSAALLTVLHIQKHDSYLGVFYIERICKALKQSLKVKNSLKSQKLMLMIVFTYHFQMSHGKLILDVLRLLSKDLNEFNVRLLLVFVKESGTKLRKDDPKFFREFFVGIKDRIKSLDTDKRSKRLDFLLEFVLDLKNNKNLFERDEISRLKKFIASVARKNQTAHFSKRVLVIGLDQFLAVHKKGKWFIDAQIENGLKIENSQVENNELIEEDSNAFDENKEIKNALLKRAEHLGINTELQKAIFVAVLSSNNFIEASKSLLRLFETKNMSKYFPNLTGKPSHVLEKDIVFVIFVCVKSENAFNPFYLYLLLRLFQVRKALIFTAKISFWRFFDELIASDSQQEEIRKTKNEEKSNEIINMSKLLAAFFTENVYSLNVFNKINWDVIGELLESFFVSFLREVIERNEMKTVLAIFSRPKESQFRRLRENLEEIMDKKKSDILVNLKDSKDAEKIKCCFETAINSLRDF